LTVAGFASNNDFGIKRLHGLPQAGPPYAPAYHGTMRPDIAARWKWIGLVALVVAAAGAAGMPKWQQGSVGRGLSKRTADWMNRKGIGKVWAGIAELDVSHCKFRSDRPIELILCEGDEKLNRTTL
jgi:hypothetical protein